jgi:regulator of nucleoside diphosphate kinase
VSPRLPYADLKTAIDRLEEELDRAEIVTPQSIPHDVITMRSRVRLRDVVSGQEMVYSLVFPNEADFSQGKNSVLGPPAANAGKFTVTTLTEN